MQASTLNRLAEVTGHPYALNQGDIEGALSYYRQALHIYQSLLEQREDKLRAEIDIANMQRKIAEIKAYQGDVLTGLQVMAGIRVHLDEVFKDVPLAQRLPLLIFYIVEAHGYFHVDYLESAEILLQRAWRIAYANQIPNPKYDLVFAFLHEETGHLALLKQQYETAKQEYLEVLNKYQGNNLWQHKRRIARVHNGLACLALRDNNTVIAQQHLEDRWKAFKKLNQKYPNVKTLQDKANELSQAYAILENEPQPSYDTLNKALRCNNPLSFMIPPVKQSL
jgi:tetratricopeptide (TPR) repeat protein